MDEAEARAHFAAARVARLATVGGEGRPHLVPVTFAVEGDTLFTAVDAKPKRTRALRRLRNVEDHPRVALLVDHWDERDWSALWWVRADGSAQVVAADEPRFERAIELLRERYDQYRAEPPAGPAIVVEVERWTGWSAAS